MTNAQHMKAKEVTEIYRERWQIELFFKWIKQNLKSRSFLTPQAARLTKIWIALCDYLMLAYLKFNDKLGSSMQQMLRLSAFPVLIPEAPARMALRVLLGSSVAL